MSSDRNDRDADAYAVKIEWFDQARNAADADAPFYFGPYATRELADAAIEFMEKYQDADREEDVDRVIGTVVPYGPHAERCQSPALLRMFMAL